MRIKSGITWDKSSCAHPWTLLGCSQRFWQNELISSQDHSLSLLKGYGDWERCPMTGRKQMLHPSFKNGEKGNYIQIDLTSVPGKIMEQVFLECISGHMKKMTGSSQHGFTEGKSRLTTLIALYSIATGSVLKVRAGDAIYLVFSLRYCIPQYSYIQVTTLQSGGEQLDR